MEGATKNFKHYLLWHFKLRFLNTPRPISLLKTWIVFSWTSVELVLSFVALALVSCILENTVICNRNWSCMKLQC